MKKTIRQFLAATLLLVAPPAAVAQVFTSELQRFRAVTVTGGLEYPWGLAFLPDGRLLVTERPGRLRIVGSPGLDRGRRRQESERSERGGECVFDHDPLLPSGLSCPAWRVMRSTRLPIFKDAE